MSSISDLSESANSAATRDGLRHIYSDQDCSRSSQLIDTLATEKLIFGERTSIVQNLKQTQQAKA